MSKKFQPQRNTRTREIVANTPAGKTFNGKNEYAVITIKKRTHECELDSIYKTKKEALKRMKRLELQGVACVKQPIIKIIDENSKTDNAYDCNYLVQDNEGNMDIVYNLDDALFILTNIERKAIGLRPYNKSRRNGSKAWVRKSYGEGYIGFAFNNKTSSVVCTRLYDTYSEANLYITKRYGTLADTIIIAKATREYNGFHISHQDLDDHKRLKHIKTDLLNILCE